MSGFNAVKNLLIFIITIGIIPICLFEFIFRDPTEAFFPKISITLIIIGLAIWYFSEGEEEPDDIKNIFYDERNVSYNQKYYNMKNRSYCYRTDLNSYNQITKKNTELEREKLYKTREFRAMYEEKGEDMKNWNWQSRERMQNEINN